MKLILLGVPGIGLHLNRWKDDVAETAENELGWNVTHLRARDIPVDEVVRACKGADMFLWSRVHGHNPAGDAYEMLRRIEDLGVPTVSQHMDLYWGVRGREEKIGLDPFWSSQFVFTADGGHQDEFAERGINHFWCPPAINRQWIGRGTTDRKKYPAKVVFVGGFYRQAHGQHRINLLRWARMSYQMDFRHYDGKRTRIWGPDLNDLYTTAHVTLGDSARADFYWSDRVVHTLGRGGMLAHCTVPGLRSQGFSKENMILYTRGGFTALGRQIEQLTPEKRLEMSDAAMTLIEERHTWKHRLLDIQRTVFP